MTCPFVATAVIVVRSVTPRHCGQTARRRGASALATRGGVTRMGGLGEVGEFGLNHIPAKNAARLYGPEGSNPSLSATDTERSALGVAI